MNFTKGELFLSLICSARVILRVHCMECRNKISLAEELIVW